MTSEHATPIKEAIELYTRGQPQRAIEVLESDRKQLESDARSCLLYARCLNEVGRVNESFIQFDEAGKLQPQWFEPHRSIIDILLHHRQYNAVDLRMKEIGPRFGATTAYHLTAHDILAHLNDRQGALNALAQARKCAGANGQNLLTVADAYRKIGETDSAKNTYVDAARDHETSETAKINLGALCFSTGEYDKAAEQYKAIDQTKIESYEWMPTYAEVCQMQGDLAQWKIVVDAYEKNTKKTLTPLRLRAEYEQFAGHPKESAIAINQAAHTVDKAEADELIEFAHLRQHYDQTATDHKLFYAAVKKHFNATQTQIKPDPSQRLQSKIRVGYLGADFQDHVMGKMTLSIIEKRSESHEVYCYATNPRIDDVTREIAKKSTRFTLLPRISDQELAAKIQADQLDILVDLSGTTAGTRPGLLARKPAPIIVSHLASSMPLGIPTIDYKLTDAICDTPENQAYLNEKLIFMEGCCYPVPRYPAPTAGVTKADLGLESKIVIGAFISHQKLSQRCLEVWREVLQKNQQAVLLFSPLRKNLQHAYVNCLTNAGFASDSYKFLPAGQTEAERLARYRCVDVVLDPMPYGGVNGTLEALYMGVPIVTQIGQHHCERTTASMLTHLGVPETIAESKDSYVAIATSLIQDSNKRAHISSEIKTRWSAFADPVDYAKRWERLLWSIAKK